MQCVYECMYVCMYVCIDYWPRCPNRIQFKSSRGTRECSRVAAVMLICSFRRVVDHIWFQTSRTTHECNSRCGDAVFPFPHNCSSHFVRVVTNKAIVQHSPCGDVVGVRRRGRPPHVPITHTLLTRLRCSRWRRRCRTLGTRPYAF